MKKNYYTILLLLTLGVLTMHAGERSKFDHHIVAGFNFGASSPFPLPSEVRAIDGYWPMFTPRLGYSITYNATPTWSVKSGIQLDLKGMGVRDKVKYMYTEVVMDGTEITGYFVGKNQTEVKASYITVPVTVQYRINDKWSVNAGGYASYRSSSEFTGTVWDGYLRDGEEIIASMKLEIPDKGDAEFSFGKEMRNFDFGWIVGADCQLNDRFSLYSNLNWGLTPIFKSSFKGIQFDMYNIYLSVGIAYNL